MRQIPKLFFIEIYTRWNFLAFFGKIDSYLKRMSENEIYP